MAAGLGLVVIAVVAGAAIVFEAVLGGPSPSASPRTALASASPPSSTTSTMGPTLVPRDGPTTRPTARPTRRPTIAPTEEHVTSAPTDRPTKAPTDVPTSAPTTAASDRPLPTVGGPPPAPPGTFECDRSSALQDPLSRGWRIQAVDWRDAGDRDRVIVTLNQFEPLAGVATQAIVHLMPVGEVADRLGVVEPSAGREAVALGLWQGVRLTWTIDRELSLPKVRWVTMGKGENGFAWLVLGVRGDACYSLQVPVWAATGDPSDASSIEVIVEVEH